MPDSSPWTPDGVIADRFQIVRELGRGGMGAVYLVFDRELCREVALKRSDLDRVGDADHEARFCREFRAAATVADPGVPQVYHSGRTAEGVLWFTMEVVRGESLRALLDRGALEPLRALDVAIGLGRILAHAHERGVIHRDVKPPNVMLEPGERVRLLDFGVCTPLPRFLRHAEARRRTRAAERWHSGDAAFVGTYGYSDPATHDGSPPTVRSDIFSVAAIAYEMLTGRRLFDPDSCVFRTIDPAELPLAAAALGDDLRAAASRDPYDRPRSMADFVQRLEIVRNTTGRSAAPPARPRRTRWLVPAAVGVGVGVATLALDAALVGRAPDVASACVDREEARSAAQHVLAAERPVEVVQVGHVGGDRQARPRRHPPGAAERAGGEQLAAVVGHAVAGEQRVGFVRGEDAELGEFGPDKEVEFPAWQTWKAEGRWTSAATVLCLKALRLYCYES